jgi:hypothetical protein
MGHASVGAGARYRLAGIGVSNFLEDEEDADAEPALFSTIPRA